MPDLVRMTKTGIEKPGFFPTAAVPYWQSRGWVIDPEGQPVGAVPDFAPLLKQTPTKTAAYTATAGQLVPVNTTSGAVVVTLPAATEGRTVAVRWDAGSNAATVTAAGSDKIGSGSATSLTVPAVGDTVVLQAVTGGGRWQLVGGYRTGAGGGAASLADLDDVDVEGAAVGAVLAVSEVNEDGDAVAFVVVEPDDVELGDIDGLSAALAAKAPALVPTGVKTGAYTAASGDLVLANATGGALTITLPAATAGRVVGVRKVDTSANAVTVAAAGSDTIGTVVPAATMALAARENVVLVATSGNWVPVSIGASVATLDTRYGIRLPGLPASRYLYTSSPNANTTSNQLGIGTLRMTPWVVSKAVTLVRIGAEISTGGEAGSKLRLVIYADDGNGLPSALVLDAGQLDAATTGVQELTVNVTLQPGVYWVGGVVQSVTTTQPTVRICNGPPALPITLGASMPGSNANVAGVAQSGVTGAAPSTLASPDGSSTAPRVFVKTAA